jgi:hypothetical protein
MILVPRQLRRSGMTGDVPYYGGRFTPAQAYAASHPPPQQAAPAPPQPSPPPPRSDASSLEAMRHLLETGVLTQAEYDELRARVPS